MISRRKAAARCTACLDLASAAKPLLAGELAPSTVQVAAVQMKAELGNVESNLVKAERLVRAAMRRGAQWVILPEFFTSGLAFHPQMAKAARPVDGAPAQLLRRLAREGRAAVGGSFLAWRDGNVSGSSGPATCPRNSSSTASSPPTPNWTGSTAWACSS